MNDEGTPQLEVKTLHELAFQFSANRHKLQTRSQFLAVQDAKWASLGSVVSRDLALAQKLDLVVLPCTCISLAEDKCIWCKNSERIKKVVLVLRGKHEKEVVKNV